MSADCAVATQTPCKYGHHVDHVLPLCGKLVSGLHVAANLQYLPARINSGKGNRFQPFEIDRLDMALGV
jgi:hypothetical protein